MAGEENTFKAANWGKGFNSRGRRNDYGIKIVVLEIPCQNPPTLSGLVGFALKNS
jgi:hypothetical protein